MVSDAKKRAIRKYEILHCIRICLKLNRTTDYDIIMRLEEVPNKTGYIKRLIRDDIGKEEP